MNINNVTDYDIQAFVDDELGHEEAKKVQEHLQQDHGAQKRYQELVSQKSLLKLWWKNQRH